MLKTTLEQWRMFKAVVDYGGFNQAALAINKSQSTIHHAVQKLERQLNVTLFQVEGRKTILTDVGKLMLRRASLLLNDAQKMEDIAEGLSRGVETHLNIAVDQLFPRHIIYCVLDEVSRQYPLVRIELMETVLSGANEMLDKGEVDIAISAIPQNPELSEQILTIEWAQVAHKDHPLHQLGRELTDEDLKAHRQIVTRDSGRDMELDGGWLMADQRWTVSHIQTSLDLVCNGLGFASYPRHIVEEKIETGILKLLPVKPKSPTQVYLIFKDADALGPVARFFIGELRDRLHER